VQRDGSVRVKSLVQKEFRQFRRDRRMVMMAIVAPLIQLTMFGYAVNLDVKDLPVAIADEDHSAASRRLVAEVAASRFFVVQRMTERSSDLIGLLDRGEAEIGVHIPHGFAREQRTGGAVVQLLVDGSDSNSAGIGAGYLAGLISRHAAQALTERRQRSGAPVRLPRLEVQPRVLYNPSLESVFYMVPAVLGVVLLVVAGTLTALAVVRERETGTLEQIMVTPLRAWELLMGKLIPFTVVGCLDLALVLSVVLFWFRVPLRGSLLLLIGSSLLFLLSTLGLGLLVSTVSRTQQQALFTMFLILMPSILLSGFVFPIANMPPPIQPLTYLIPLRYFLVIVRSVMLKGSGLAALWPQVLALAAWSLGLFAAGTARFRKRLQ